MGKDIGKPSLGGGAVKEISQGQKMQVVGEVREGVKLCQKDERGFRVKNRYCLSEEREMRNYVCIYVCIDTVHSYRNVQNIERSSSRLQLS